MVLRNGGSPKGSTLIYLMSIGERLENNSSHKTQIRSKGLVIGKNDQYYGKSSKDCSIPKYM